MDGWSNILEVGTGIRKFGRESEEKAWLLLDNSSTHVLPDNAINTFWDVDGFKRRGFKMSHTNADFALYVKLKGRRRKKYVEWVLEDSKVRKDWLQTSASRI